MGDDFADVFASLKPVLAKYAKRLAVKADTANEYTLVTKRGSPFPQHKGQPLFFGSVRVGKAYVSFHLLPIYMCPAIQNKLSPALRKRMQGKACFNFRVRPESELVKDLAKVTKAGFDEWKAKKWL